MHRLKHTLSTLLLLSSLLTPFGALSAARLEVQDAVAGVGTVVRLQGFSDRERVGIVLDGPDQTEITLRATLDRSGRGSVHIPGSSLKKAGEYTVYVLEERASLTVFPDKLSQTASSVSVQPLRIEADGTDEALVTVTLADRYGNPLAGRPLELISSRPSDRITALARETDETGAARFSVRTKTKGTMSLRVLDLLSDTLLEQTITVTAGEDLAAMGGDDPEEEDRRLLAQLIDRAYAQDRPFDVIDHFEVTIDNPTTLRPGVVTNVRVTAKDRNNQTVESYTGTVTFSSTDPGATLPGLPIAGASGTRSTFTDRNLGTKVFPLALSFQTAGTHTLTVEDRTDPTNIITGEATVTVTGQATVDATRRIEILYPQKNAAVSDLNFALKIKGPRYTNVYVTGTALDTVVGETDGAGNASIDVSLKRDRTEFTLRVRSEDNRYDSGDIYFKLDDKAPPLENIVFTPERPEEGDTVLLSVMSEPGITDMALHLGDQKYALTESEGGPYEVPFIAGNPGENQASIIARDPAGNKTEVRVPFTIVPRALPTVQGVEAEAVEDGVILTWLPVEDDVNYRVYYGTDLQDQETVDTEDPTPGVKLTSLTPGTLYIFQITAVKGERESAEKSSPVTARMFGLQFDVIPAVNSLALSWDIPTDDENEFSSFVLDYGAEEDRYTERRVVHGALREMVLRDLLPDVTYYLKLTPVNVEGELLSDQAATGEGIPLSPEGGFHASPGDEIPDYNPDLYPPDDELHGGAPSTTDSGIPSVAWGLAAAAVLFLAWRGWQHKRSERVTVRFLQAMDQRYHS